jgi:mRNA interferase YafQ
MLVLRYTASFKKDSKRMQKRGHDTAKFRPLLEQLASGETHKERYKDHPMRDRYADARDCHIEPDWVLAYVIVRDEFRLLRTGTQADLFKK